MKRYRWSQTVHNQQVKLLYRLCEWSKTPQISNCGVTDLKHPRLNSRICQMEMIPKMMTLFLSHTIWPSNTFEADTIVSSFTRQFKQLRNKI